ncbi:MAG: MBL fold metallo-hydrolase [Thermoleophilia bacterium]|nr:MBL fold metallo-hydrolase [Thermoleophilia bacterium]
MIRSFGGAGTVTGSCHLIELGGSRVLVDCGLFQGSEALARLNDDPFGFDPAEVDAVVLTHAHLDHSGRLPLLVRRGFRGPVHALPATRDLCEHLLADTVKLRHEDAERDRRKGRPVAEAPFGAEDVAEALGRFRPLAYGRPAEVAGLVVTPRVAGHIPGSASLLMAHGGTRLVCSGDIGNARKDVMPDPPPCPPADLVLMESTYGDRDHRPFPETLAELAHVIREGAARGGKILIPSFALERTQDVLYHIARMEEAHEVPVLPVYVDSPLATRIEQVYQAFPEEFSDDVRVIYRRGRDPFRPKRLIYTRTVDESKAINASREAAIVIAGSGMLSGGRILHHLRAHLPDPDTTVVIVGYQPRGGLGRRLVEGDPVVRVMGREVDHRARVATIGGLSAHAGRSELIDWARGAGAGAEVRLAHGEQAALEALREGLTAAGLRARVQPSEVPIPAGGRHDEGE